MMIQTKFYRAEGVAPGVTRIFAQDGELCYLVAGEAKALLIDTTTGRGDIREVVSQLTALPLVVVNTHGHMDHTGGDYVFDEVYIHPADLWLLRGPADEAAAKELICHPIGEGDCFDLGGRVLEVVEVPGHTLGSVALLDREARQIFMGDACNTNTLLIPGHSTTVEEYRESLVKLWAMEPLFDRFFVFHGDGELPKTCIDDVLELCDEILAGENVGVPYSHRGLKINGVEIPWVRARNYPTMGVQPDGKSGNLVYTKDRVFR